MIPLDNRVDHILDHAPELAADPANQQTLNEALALHEAQLKDKARSADDKAQLRERVKQIKAALKVGQKG